MFLVNSTLTKAEVGGGVRERGQEKKKVLIRLQCVRNGGDRRQRTSSATGMNPHSVRHPNRAALIMRHWEG